MSGPWSLGGSPGQLSCLSPVELLLLSATDSTSSDPISKGVWRLASLAGRASASLDGQGSWCLRTRRFHCSCTCARQGETAKPLLLVFPWSPPAAPSTWNMLCIKHLLGSLQQPLQGGVFVAIFNMLEGLPQVEPGITQLSKKVEGLELAPRSVSLRDLCR